jgi:hypothetical protein
MQYNAFSGSAVAQAGSRRLPIETARIQARVRLSWICGKGRRTEAGFLRVFRFPLLSIQSNAAHLSPSIIIIRGWYNRPVNACSNTGLGPNPPQRNNKIAAIWRHRKAPSKINL